MNLTQLIIYGVLGIFLLFVYIIIKKKVFGTIRGELPKVPKKVFLSKKSDKNNTEK